MRRKREELEEMVRRADSDAQRALACFHLAVFHDNNTREAEAIPWYRKAIRLGLEPENEARAHAWLASSLFKTGKGMPARKQIALARRLTKDGRLLAFLTRLERRLGPDQP